MSEVESVPTRSKFRSLNNKTVFLEICLNTRSIATKPMPSLERGTNKTKGFVQSDTNEVGSLLDVQVFFGWRSDSCFNTLKAF